MLVIGYPAPPATPAAVAATSPLALNCNVHGNEPSDREGCQYRLDAHDWKVITVAAG
jgi:hypothetical protein